MSGALWQLDDLDAARAIRRGAGDHLVHRAGDRWLVSDPTRRAAERARSSRAAARGLRRHEVDRARWAAAAAGLIVGWNGATGEPLPDDVRREAVLWLYTRPDLQLEYMGRGRFVNDARLPCPPEDLVYLDTAGGRRSYAFRVLRAGPGQLDERSRVVGRALEERQRWLADPEARIVLSVGGGGYRLFAALHALKIIERMLAGDRARVHEVWGSSGGALLGYVFARGIDLRAIDRLAFDLYHGRRKEVAGIHLRSLLHFGGRLVGDLARGRTGGPELASWVTAVDPADNPPGTLMPYYALVSNTRWRHPVAFTEADNIAEHCRDILMPCDSRAATAASMSVPFLFRPLRGVAGYEDDAWFDGSIVDENPIMLPFVKWLRDRKRDPAGTPRRLKIVLVNLNMRMSESTLLAALDRGARGVVRRAMDVVDLLLDSKTHALIRTLTEVDDVEIMSATLTLGSLSFITRTAIPSAIRAGQIFEGWKLDLHARGREVG